MKYIVAIICLLFSPHIAEAVTRYATISASGCGISSSTYNPVSNTCGPGIGTQRAHIGVGAIQAAANESTGGDIIEVRGLVSTRYTGSAEGNTVTATGTAGGCGRSSSTFTSLGTSTCLTIRGYQSERPLVRGFRDVSYAYIQNLIVDANNITDSVGIMGVNFSRIENVEVRFAGIQGFLGINNTELVGVNSHHNGFADSTGTCPPLSPNGGQCHGFYSGGSGEQNLLIDGGEWHDNSGYGIQCYTTCNNTTIRNVKLYNNGHNGMIVVGSTGTQVYNVLAYNNGSHGIHFAATNGVLYSATIYNNGGDGVCVDATSVTVRNVLSVGNTGTNIGTNCNGTIFSFTQSNNITTGTATSHFAAAANGDFRLCRNKGDPTASCPAASSAIGAGTQLNSIFTTDILAATRGTVWDAGAYESSSVVTPIVVVTSPTLTGTYSASSSPLSISGTFQSGAPLTSVTWSNSLGGSGTATGTSNWTIPAVNLTAGVNVITITGTDANSLTGQATLTVTYAPGSLVGAWSCDEGAGATVNDASGNSNTGTFTSPVWSGSGKFGAACSLNGSTGVITVADSNSLDLIGGATLQAWVFPTVQTSAWRSLFSKGENYYLFSSSDQQCGTSNLYGGFINGTTYNVTCYSVPLPINTWTFVTLRMDGTSVNIYTGTTATDFALRSSLSTTQAMVTNASSLAIGNTTSEPFAGLMDNMRIYNYARSAAAGSGACGLGYSELQCDMITAINPGASIIIQLNVTALQLGPGVVLEMGTAP